jgi:hypothetical protein
MENPKVIMDIRSIPGGWSIEQFMSIYTKTGFVFWDSSDNGVKPILMNSDTDVKIIDISINN